MALAKLIVLHVLAAPAFVLGYLYVGLTFVTLTSHRLKVETPTMHVSGYWRPWVKRLIKSVPSFTLGYGYILSSDRCIPHERVHVRQFQDVSVQGFVLAVVFSIVLLEPWILLAWPTMLLTMLMFYLTAWLRGSTDMVHEPEHEASAYAQTK